MAAGWSKHWALTNTGGRFEYVLAYARGPLTNPRTVPVARLIAPAPKGRRVTYIDGDRTTLRRANLRIVQGGGLTNDHSRPLRTSHDARSEECRVGKACFIQCRSRLLPDH